MLISAAVPGKLPGQKRCDEDEEEEEDDDDEFLGIFDIPLN